jgi:hypothetical protein
MSGKPKPASLDGVKVDGDDGPFQRRLSVPCSGMNTAFRCYDKPAEAFRLKSMVRGRRTAPARSVRAPGRSPGFHG